jgi:DNA-binding GntR family transcriptional regulator
MDRLALHLPLSDRVYRAILDAICDGELTPGQRITQDELAERLDVSRQPVLQALRLLKTQGFVRDSQRRGVVVSSLDATFIAHLCEVRSALDGMACRAAARRGQADARTWGPKLIADGRAAVRSGSVHDLIAADMRFHLFLHELSGNPLIAETAAIHWQHIRRVMGGSLRRRYLEWRGIWDEHAAILDAVMRGDAEAAERAARQHAEAAAVHLIRSIEAESAPKKTGSGRTGRSKSGG